MYLVCSSKLCDYSFTAIGKGKTAGMPRFCPRCGKPLKGGGK